MLYEKVWCGAQPEPVVEELLPEGGRRIVMSRGFAVVPVEDEGTGTAWMGQQADFGLEEGCDETVEDIAADFDRWWLYAESWERSQGTPEQQRLTALEQQLAAAKILLGVE